VDIYSYGNKDCVHPKCDKAIWAKTHLHKAHTIAAINHTFKNKNIFGLNHRISLKKVLGITCLVLVLQRDKQNY
jgi:hypothetical protein